MTATVFPLSSDKFGYEVDISGVRLAALRDPLFSAVLSDELVDLWIGKTQAELASVGVEMKAALRKQRETPLFGGDDA
jgi:hypothetical protein